MANGTVKWFNATKDMGSFSLPAVAGTCSSMSQPLSGLTLLVERGTKRRVRDREQSGERVRGQPQDQMTILPTRPVELNASACRTCGACCSFSPEWPRFSLESDADLDQIPQAYVDCDLGRMRCNGNRCAALVGEVGISTACAIYTVRPDVCRACLPGDDSCKTARRRFNL
jgi:hypothetical protein